MHRLRKLKQTEIECVFQGHVELSSAGMTLKERGTFVLAKVLRWRQESCLHGPSFFLVENSFIIVQITFSSDIITKENI